VRNQLRGGVEFQLSDDVGAVLAHCELSDAEALRDVPSTKPLADQGQHFFFPPSETRQFGRSIGAPSRAHASIKNLLTQG
jgi:hypothetical protein